MKNNWLNAKAGEIEAEDQGNSSLVLSRKRENENRGVGNRCDASNS